MGSLSFGEIFTILVIILIIFGPNRLPEFARKIGQMIAWGRKSLQDFTDSVQTEAGDGLQPLADLKAEFDGARQDLSGAVATLTGTSNPEPLKPQSAGGPTDRRSQASDEQSSDDDVTVVGGPSEPSSTEDDDPADGSASVPQDADRTPDGEAPDEPS